jgi:hypothetical protein
MKTISLCLCLALATAAVARADQDLVIVPKLTFKEQALRRARAEIISGGIILGVATVAFIMATWIWSTIGSCPPDECESIAKLMGAGFTAAFVLDGSIGTAVFSSGFIRQGEANRRVKVRPTGGPGGLGGGLRVDF